MKRHTTILTALPLLLLMLAVVTGLPAQTPISVNHETEVLLIGIVVGLLFWRHNREQLRRIGELTARLEQQRERAEKQPDAETDAHEQPEDETAPEEEAAAEADPSVETPDAKGKFEVRGDDGSAVFADAVRTLMATGECDLARVSAYLNLSPSQFRRRVQAMTGLTPSNFILSVRMDEAKRLLVEGDSQPGGPSARYTISEVAYRCGFTDGAHFTHAFKRLYGMSPTQFREDYLHFDR
ncbi:MAG: helix-turn-helix transcriptional regulator [Prevotella sp.]|nr:helix-turn-helix transcriptional regulator [Prevotella sp.]